MKKTVLNILYVCAFLSIVMLPAVFTDHRADIVSEIDNKKLVNFPEWKDPAFTEKTEAYLRDRIGFRKQMISAYAQINNGLAHELTHPLYTYGQNNYVFFKMHYNITYSSYHDSFADMIIKLNDYCEDSMCNLIRKRSLSTGVFCLKA